MQYFLSKYTATFLYLLIPVVFSFAQKNEKSKNTEQVSVFKYDVPSKPYDIILTQKNETTTVLNIKTIESFTGSVFYKSKDEEKWHKTRSFNFEKEKSTPVELTGLTLNNNYQYQIILNNENNEVKSEIYQFHTPRNQQVAFSFAVQADSHLDENTDTGNYLQTLRNISNSSADFLVDLGDTWMTDKHKPDYQLSLKQYLAQRYYFGSVCHSMPLFLTLGNHDGECGKEKEKDMRNWAYQTRMQLYNNPDNPNNQNEDFKNYYSWRWGNGLFIVLDPFRYTKDNKVPWNRTLGKEQFLWLEKTLASENTAFKFVFIHNLVGGVDNKGIARGGAEASLFYEWGGLNRDSSIGFSANRPGWSMPIHDLFKKYNVTAVFHGHDHFFAHQERDGIIYQLVPQPGSMRSGNLNMAEDYGYKSGKMLNVPGFLKISVGTNEAKVELIKSSLHHPSENNIILHSYTIRPKKND